MLLKRLRTNLDADMGIGALIIFIAMILVAGITASVMIQTMNSLQQQAVRTTEETIKDISSGLKVTQVSGYVLNSSITQLAIFVTPTAASESIDLTYGLLTLSDSTTKVILNYSSACFRSSVTNGLFNTLNASNLTSAQYGIIVVRDIDGSCNATNPLINDEDMIVILVNTDACFSGIGTRTEISGEIYPEHGMRGIIGFTTPSALSRTIVDLQP
jgi:flagellin FlaB